MSSLDCGGVYFKWGWEAEFEDVFEGADCGCRSGVIGKLDRGS